MKLNLVLLMIAGFLSAAVAQTEKSLPSKITSATVYNDRALITRTATATFSAGKYTVAIPSLPLSLIDQTIRVAGEGTAQAKILEVRVEPVLTDSIPLERVRELRAKKLKVVEERSSVENRLSGVKRQNDFLKQISVATSDDISKQLRSQRPTMEDWQKILGFLDANNTRLGNEQWGLEQKLERLRADERALDMDIARAGGSAEPYSKQAFVEMEIAKAGNLSLDVSYLIQNASWEPLYDARASTNERKLELTYNAQVWQATGEDWNNISLILSTAQPVVGGSRPTLTPWFVDIFGAAKGAIQGFVRDAESGIPISGVTVAARGTERTATTNADGVFVLENIEPGDYELQFSGGGHRRATSRVQVVPYQTSRADITLNQIPVSESGVEAIVERPQIMVSKTNSVRTAYAEIERADGSARFQTATLQAGVTSAAYEIGAKVSVPSNQTRRKVTIAIIPLSGDFSYSTTPKIRPKAYYTAKVVNSTEYPLLAGPMSIFVDDNYVGGAHLQAVMPGEKFDASLGVDDGIRVERKTINKRTESTGLFTRAKKTSYDILLTVENLKKISSTITIMDNIPISRDERIKVALDSPTGDQVKPDAEGKLQWKLDLKAGEKRELPLRFSVEYPADLTVSALE
jgi:hypothetical protein